MVEAMTAMVVMRKRGTSWKMFRSGSGAATSVTYSGGAFVVVGSGGGAP